MSVSELIGPSRQRLQTLLKEYNEYPERHDEIDTRIHDEFCKEVAIVVIDSCGFSRNVRQHGIVNYLARLERLGRMVEPLIATHGGRVLKFEADNVFALFPDTASAVRFASEAQHNVEIANDPLPAASEIYIAIGVGYGRVLLIENEDAFGDEMNVACKLGEDLAEQGEILVTEAARNALGESDEFRFEDFKVQISGLELNGFKVIR